MALVKVASVKDVKPDGIIKVEVGGKEVCVANVGDKYYAIGDRCTHMGCLLSDGTLRGENVTCPCHGSVFSVLTGAVVKGPARKPEPVYPVKLDGDQVLADL